MTVKELKEKLSNLPDNLFVFVDIDLTTQEGFQFQLVNGVRQQVVGFGEGDGRALAKDDCVILELA